MLITIDPYYTITEYRQATAALDNNKINYKEFLSIRAPYNWYVDLESIPSMTNFDEITKSQERFLVNIIKPIRPNEEYLVQRRDNDKGEKAIERFVLNDPLREAEKSDYSCFFNVKSSDELREISKSVPGTKFYYFGKYFGNKYKIVLCNNKMIRNFVQLENILTEKSPKESVIDMEVELNYKFFRLRERLEKYTEQPYFLDGKYFPVKIENFTGNF